MELKFDLSDFVNVLTKDKVQCSLVNRFIERRKELKLSRKELSNKSGVAYETIRRFERTGDISFSSLLSLAEAMNYLSDFENVFKRVALKTIINEKNKYEKN